MRLLCVLLATGWCLVASAWKPFGHAAEPSMELHCFRGSKMGVMSDPREETVQCGSMFGLEQYCYKFSAYSPVHEMVKLGCASVMCSPFRNTCADFELAGVQGRLCCCNHGSYCNASTSRQPIIITLALLVIIPLIWRL